MTILEEMIDVVHELIDNEQAKKHKRLLKLKQKIVFSTLDIPSFVVHKLYYLSSSLQTSRRIYKNNTITPNDTR